MEDFVLNRWRFGIVVTLWTLTFVLVSSSCPDINNVSMPCGLGELDGVDCSYIKGLPTSPIPEKGEFLPAKVDNLNVETYLGDKCTAYLNITWKINKYGNQQYLRGFLLNVTFIYGDQQRNISRYFNLTVSKWSDDVYRTFFRHECISPASDTRYRVQLHSIPTNSPSDPDPNFAVVEYHTSRGFTSQPCTPPANPEVSYDWVATMWTVENPANSSINVCFFTAPPEFNFSIYVLSLLSYEDSELHPTFEQRKIFTGNRTIMDRMVCEMFTNVCSGVYKIWVLPDDVPYCTCRNGRGMCRSCSVTTFEPINMTSSVCSLTTTSLSPSASPLGPSTDSVLYPSTEIPRMPESKLAGIIGGLLAGVLAVIVVFLFVLFRVCNCKGRIITFSKNGTDFDHPEISVVKSQPVLIVYSADDENHRKVVQNFAAFLQTCCKCDVRYDEWSQVEISQTSALDWLTKQLRQVRHVIIINSHGGFLQRQGWIDNNMVLPAKDLLLPDMFLPALRQIENLYYLQNSSVNPEFHYYHIYFPYTRKQHLLDVSFGKRYKLMNHIEDLFLNMHGMSKVNKDGRTCSKQINAKSYTNFREGQALEVVILEACKNYQANPDWPQDCCKRIATDLETERPDDDVYPLRPSSEISISSCETKDETKTSFLENNSDAECIPPSTEGSINIDVEGQSSSPDVGYEGMIDDDTCEQQSPSIFFLSPPADDGISIGSQSFITQMNEWNEQYDSGLPCCSFELASDRTSC